MSPETEPQAPARAKPRTRTVVEVHLRDIQIITNKGAMTVFLPDNSKDIRMVADLDARTIGIKVPGRGTTIVPFESTKLFKYGMGVPKAD